MRDFWVDPVRDGLITILLVLTLWCAWGWYRADRRSQGGLDLVDRAVAGWTGCQTTTRLRVDSLAAEVQEALRGAREGGW